MHVVIFETSHWRSLAPLSLSRPVFAMRSGCGSLLRKQVRHARPSRLSLWVRPEMAEFCRRRVLPEIGLPGSVNAPLDEEPALLLNASALLDHRWQAPAEHAVSLGDDGAVCEAMVTLSGLGPADALEGSSRWEGLLRLPRREAGAKLLTRPWDLVAANLDSIVDDYVSLPAGSAKPAGPYHLMEAEKVWLGEGVTIAPGAVLDASKGPVIVDAHAAIGANAVLQGPCYVGPQSQIMPVAIVRPGTSIGPTCKVGGEVSNSIIVGYSNKAHEGFLGDSYIGKWANLGAGTTTSNLKNTYGQISAITPDGEIKTGRQFFGSAIGDHARTAIGTRLMAGAYVGFSAMLATSAMAPRFVPSFSFCTDRGMEPYRLDKAIEVMKTVFARRSRGWDDIDEQVVRYAAAVGGEIERAGMAG